MSGYLFEREWGPEDRRLQLLQDRLDRVSHAVLNDLGLRPGWRCWEVGAGGGSVAAWLADQVGSGGTVMATDIDTTLLSSINRGNVTVIRHDVALEMPPQSGFDLVHARLVLEHLGDPGSVITQLAGTLVDGGWLVIEDADGLKFESEPASAVLGKLALVWEQAAINAGWNANYGRRLIADLQSAGLNDVAGRGYRDYFVGGEAWEIAQTGISRLEDQILMSGLTRAELDEARAALTDNSRTIVGATIVSAWGRRGHRGPNRKVTTLP